MFFVGEGLDILEILGILEILEILEIQENPYPYLSSRMPFRR